MTKIPQRLFYLTNEEDILREINHFSEREILSVSGTPEWQRAVDIGQFLIARLEQLEEEEEIHYAMRLDTKTPESSFDDEPPELTETKQTNQHASSTDDDECRR